jgi:hypothetical protein
MRAADQVGVVELHAGALVPVIYQHLDPCLLQFGLQRRGCLQDFPGFVAERRGPVVTVSCVLLPTLLKSRSFRARKRGTYGDSDAFHNRTGT